LDAEVSNSTRAAYFAKDYPERFFEMFIAEQNMVSVAVGLARRGWTPYVSTFAAFFTRAADQIRMAQYSRVNITFVGSHAGVSIGHDGSSQMGLEDLALFRSLRESVVFYPAGATATHKLLCLASQYEGIAYIRTTRAKTDVLYDHTEEFRIGGSKTLRTSAADTITIVSAGITLFEALDAADECAKEGISVRVIDAYCIKPLDSQTLIAAAQKTRAVITVEDHYEAGGLGEAVCALLSTAATTPVYRLYVQKEPHSGSPHELLEYEKIDKTAILELIRSISHRL
jgi:transketolase